MNSYGTKGHFCSGKDGKYMRHTFPRTYLINYLKLGNKYIKSISEREFWDNVNKDLKDIYIKNAEKWLDYVWKSVPAFNTYLNFFISGKTDEKYHFDNRTSLFSLTVGECLENKGRFIPQIINGIFSVAEQTTWSAAAHLMPCGKAKEKIPEYDDDVYDLQAMRTGMLFAFVYGTMKDKLDEYSPAVSRRLKYEVKKRVLDPFLNEDLYFMGFNVDFGWETINNWNTFSNISAIYCALTVCDSLRECYPVISKAIDSLDNFIDNYPEDGACDEGPGYWMGAGAQLSICIDLLDSCMTSKPSSIFDNEKIHNMMKYIINTRILKNYSAAVADAQGKSQSCSPEYLYNIGVIYNDDAFKNEAKSVYKFGNFTPETALDPIDTMLTLMHYDNFIKSDDLSDKAEKSVYMESIQMMIARESEEREKGLYLMSKGGHNAESHNHNDLGEVIVFKDGKPVMIDVGIGTYDNFLFKPETRYVKHWVTNGFNHSVPIIGGCEEIEGAERKAENVSYISDEACDSHSMELKSAYKNSDKIISLKRTNMLDRKNAFISVTDECNFVEAMDYEDVFMLASEPAISGNTVKTGNAALEVISEEKTEIAFEKIELTDPKLSISWGDAIYKLKIKASNIKKAKIAFKIY